MQCYVFLTVSESGIAACAMQIIAFPNPRGPGSEKEPQNFDATLFKYKMQSSLLGITRFSDMHTPVIFTRKHVDEPIFCVWFSPTLSLFDFIPRANLEKEDLLSFLVQRYRSCFDPPLLADDTHTQSRVGIAGRSIRRRVFNNICAGNFSSRAKAPNGGVSV